jgi:hypothetical protein
MQQALAARILASHPAETELYRHAVTWLQTMNIEALEAVRDRLSKAQDTRGRWLQTAQAV